MRGPFPRHTFFLTERLVGENLVLGARAVVTFGGHGRPRGHWLSMLCHELPKRSGLQTANMSHRTQFLWIGTQRWLSWAVEGQGVCLGRRAGSQGCRHLRVTGVEEASSRHTVVMLGGQQSSAGCSRKFQCRPAWGSPSGGSQDDSLFFPE